MEVGLGQSLFNGLADLLIQQLCGKLASVPSHITTLLGLLCPAAVTCTARSGGWKLS